MLGPILLSLHNIAYYQRLMAEARAAIETNQFAEFHAEKLRGWRRLGEGESPL
jgi:queuine tRNA-ribosyltransferase